MTSKLLAAQSVPIPTQLAAWIANAFDTDKKRRDKGYAGSCAAMVQQIHYYITQEFGAIPKVAKQTLEDGRRWIFKSYVSWQEVFPWLTDYAFRKVRCLLVELEIIEVKQLGLRQQGRDRTCWYTVNYEHPFLQQLLSTDAQQADSTDASGSNSTDASNDRSTTASVECQRIPITTSNTTGNTLSGDANQKEKKEKAPSEPTLDSSIGKQAVSEVSSDMKLRSKANANIPRPKRKFSGKDKFSAALVEPWEVAPFQPYPYFLQWRALHYKNQGGHWANSPLTNAYAEFYKNRAKTNILWQEFLQFYNLVLDNALALQAAGIEVKLPSCLSDGALLNEAEIALKAQALGERLEKMGQASTQIDNSQLGTDLPNKPAPFFTSPNASENKPTQALAQIAPDHNFCAKMSQLVRHRTLAEGQPEKQRSQDLLQMYLEWLNSGEKALIDEAQKKLKRMVMERMDLEADWDEEGKLINVTFLR